MNLVGNHGKIEKNIFLLLLRTFVTVIIGGLVEIVPLFTVESTIEKVQGCAPIRRWSLPVEIFISLRVLSVPQPANSAVS